MPAALCRGGHLLTRPSGRAGSGWGVGAACWGRSGHPAAHCPSQPPRTALLPPSMSLQRTTQNKHPAQQTDSRQLEQKKAANKCCIAANPSPRPHRAPRGAPRLCGVWGVSVLGGPVAAQQAWLLGDGHLSPPTQLGLGAALAGSQPEPGAGRRGGDPAPQCRGASVPGSQHPEAGRGLRARPAGVLGQILLRWRRPLQYAGTEHVSLVHRFLLLAGPMAIPAPVWFGGGGGGSCYEPIESISGAHIHGKAPLELRLKALEGMAGPFTPCRRGMGFSWSSEPRLQVQAPEGGQLEACVWTNFP